MSDLLLNAPLTVIGMLSGHVDHVRVINVVDRKVFIEGDASLLPLNMKDEGRIWIRGWHAADSSAVQAARTVFALAMQRNPITCGECGAAMDWYEFEGVYVCSNNECGAQSP